MVHREKSKDFKNIKRKGAKKDEMQTYGENDPDGDIIKYVIRATETMKLEDLDQFLAYPFESLGFTMKFELSEFEALG